MKAFAIISLLLLSTLADAGTPHKTKHPDSLDTYLSRLRSMPSGQPPDRTTGSLWTDSGLLADAASDLRARSVGDLITVQIVELTTASASASVNTQRAFSASSGISALGGKINTSGMETLFSPSSAQSLKGQGATTADSKLQTTLSGRIVAVLPSGALVVEAQRDVMINDQRNRIIVRGVARPSDISADDAIVSTKLSDLEVELSGKGAVNDGTRQPNVLMRWLLRLLNF